MAFVVPVSTGRPSERFSVSNSCSVDGARQRTLESLFRRPKHARRALLVRSWLPLTNRRTVTGGFVESSCCSSKAVTRNFSCLAAYLKGGWEFIGKEDGPR